MYQIPFLVKNKEKVRFVLYLFSALLIVNFFWSIFNVASSIDDHIVPQDNFYDLKIDFVGDMKMYNVPKTIDYNQELGGKILSISFDLINIMFLIGFMLLLYIDERFEKLK